MAGGVCTSDGHPHDHEYTRMIIGRDTRVGYGPFSDPLACLASARHDSAPNRIVDRSPATPPNIPPTAERTTGESDEPPPPTREQLEHRRRSHLATAQWWPRLTLIDALTDWQPYRTTWVTRPLTCHLCGTTTHQPAGDAWQWRVAQARGKSGRYTQSRCGGCANA